jgi:hypothetical protein
VHQPSQHGCTPHRLVIDTIAEYYAHLLQATGLLLCRLIGPQHRRPCVRFTVTCASMTMLHNPCCAIRLHKVFVLLIGSSSSSCRYSGRR